MLVQLVVEVSLVVDDGGASVGGDVDQVVASEDTEGGATSSNITGGGNRGW